MGREVAGSLGSRLVGSLGVWGTESIVEGGSVERRSVVERSPVVHGGRLSPVAGVAISGGITPGSGFVCSQLRV